MHRTVNFRPRSHEMQQNSNIGAGRPPIEAGDQKIVQPSVATSANGWLHEVLPSEVASLDELLPRLKEANPPDLPLTADEVNQAFQMMHPKGSVIKDLPRGAILLDLRAGDGSLIAFKNWLSFPRSDVQLLASP